MKEKIKKFIKSNYIWIFCISVFISIAIIVELKEILEIDIRVYNFFVYIRNDILNYFFKLITIFGNASMLIFLTVLSIIFLKEKKYKILIPANLALIGFLNYTFKHIFLRQRPNELRLIQESGYSFPSGHAMSGTAFYGLLIYICYKNIKNKKIRNTICTLISLLIILIDISRVYIGVHYMSDVLAGTFFSIAYLSVILKLIKMKN